MDFPSGFSYLLSSASKHETLVAEIYYQEKFICYLFFDAGHQLKIEFEVEKVLNNTSFYLDHFRECVDAASVRLTERFK